MVEEERPGDEKASGGLGRMDKVWECGWWR
jgi:hypothetical protein